MSGLRGRVCTHASVMPRKGLLGVSAPEVNTADLDGRALDSDMSGSQRFVCGEIGTREWLLYFKDGRTRAIYSGRSRSGLTPCIMFSFALMNGASTVANDVVAELWVFAPGHKLMALVVFDRQSCSVTLRVP